MCRRVEAKPKPVGNCRGGPRSPRLLLQGTRATRAATSATAGRRGGFSNWRSKRGSPTCCAYVGQALEAEIVHRGGAHTRINRRFRMSRVRTYRSCGWIGEIENVDAEPTASSSLARAPLYSAARAPVARRFSVHCQGRRDAARSVRQGNPVEDQGGKSPAAHPTFVPALTVARTCSAPFCAVQKL